MQNREQRQFPRVELKTQIFCSEFSLYNKASKKFSAYLKNVSGGGIQFETKHKFPVNALIYLEVEIPGWEREKIGFIKIEHLHHRDFLKVLASVIRVEYNEKKDTYSIATKFVAIDPFHQEALTKYLSKLINRKYSQTKTK